MDAEDRLHRELEEALEKLASLEEEMEGMRRLEMEVMRVVGVQSREELLPGVRNLLNLTVLRQLTASAQRTERCQKAPKMKPCPACKEDLSEALETVPGLVVRRTFPFRCPLCHMLLMVDVTPDGGATLRLYPVESILSHLFEKPGPKRGERAG